MTGGRTVTIGRGLFRGPWSRRLAVCLVVAAASPSAMGKTEVGLSLVNTAFPPKAQTGAWTQFQVSVFNESARDVLADVVYRTDDPALGEVRFSRRVWLPSRSFGQVVLAARPGILNPEVRTEGLVFARQSIDLVDANTGQILDRTTDLLVQPVTIACCCAIDQAPVRGRYSYVRGEGISWLPPMEFAQTNTLPDCWYAFSGMRMVMVGRLNMDAQRAGQVEALLDWVTDGGVLVFFADEGTERMMLSPLGRAARVTVAGAGEVTHLSLAGVLRAGRGTMEFKQPEVDLPAPTLRLNLQSEGAEVLCTSDGVPLMTHASLGLGHVFVVGLPCGALEMEPLWPLWGRIGQAIRFPPAVQPGQFQARSLAALEAISGSPGVGRGVALLLLGGLAVVAAGVGAAATLRRRGEWAWAVCLPLALLLSLGMYGWSRLQRSAPSVSSVALAVSDGGGRAMVHQVFSYYSPDDRRVDLYSGSPMGEILPLVPQAEEIDQPAARPVAARMSSFLARTNVRQGAGLLLPGVDIAPNSAPMFSLASAMDLGGDLATSLRFGPEGLQGEIANATPIDFSDAVIYIRGRCYAVDDLPAGATTAVSVTSAGRLDAGRFIPRLVQSSEDRLRNSLAAGLAPPPLAFQQPDERPYLLAWSSRPLAQPTRSNGPLRSVGMMLFVQPVRLGPSPAGSRVRLPEEMLARRFPSNVSRAGFPRELRELPALLADPGGQFGEMRGPAILEVSLAPPVEVGPLAQARANLRIVVRASAYRLAVFGRTPQDELVPLKTYDNPSGPQGLAVEQAERFAQADGTVRFTLAVTPPMAGEAPSAGREIQPAPPGVWKIESVDATLEGTVR